MIKNGRPYTDENGYIDDALITRHNYVELKLVGDWIKNNIRKSGVILHGRTSYGLKHLLKSDINLYLTNNTNNEFKDAMLLSGYKPVNPDELNWRYRIILTREINSNPSPFFKWVKQFKDDRNPRGDFARDMINDFKFPVFAEHDLIEEYLNRNHACKGALKAFEELWSAYARETAD